MFENKVGIELEFFVTNTKNELTLPADYIPTDAFPLLGEIRAEPGDNVADCYSNFVKEKLLIQQSLPKSKNMAIEACRRVPLALYREAMAKCNVPKGQAVSGVKNIYNIDISDFSDQIIKDGKIQGINSSCGLHLHFSCRHHESAIYEEAQYSRINIPLQIEAKNIGVEEILKSSLDLFKRDGYKEIRTLKAASSLLNKPTIEWMVKELDTALFSKYMKGVKPTKYRQPGFFELKPYGFEYRSLPATVDVIQDLPDILSFCFKLLKEAKTYV